jgi:hypothetical protein
MSSISQELFRKNSLKKNPLFSSRKIFEHLIYSENNSFKLIIELKEGEKEIYLVGNFYKYNISYLSKKKKIYDFIQSNFYLNCIKLRFKIIGKFNINSIYLINGKKNRNDSRKNFENNIKLFLTDNNQKKSMVDKESTQFSTNYFSLVSSKQKNNNLNFHYSKKNYCNYYPKKNEMREKADKIPTFFPIECFNGVNHYHNEIGNKEFLNLTDNSIYNNNIDSYKIIDRKDHLLLNHFCYKIVKTNVINAFTVKYRNKNVTFLYYK